MATNENVNNLKIHKFKNAREMKAATELGLIKDNEIGVIEQPWKVDCATRAIQDGEGNEISKTYVPVTGNAPKQMGIRFDYITKLSDNSFEVYQREECNSTLPADGQEVYLILLEDVYGPFSLDSSDGDSTEVVYNITSSSIVNLNFNRADAIYEGDYNEAYSGTMWCPEAPDAGYFEITGNSFVSGVNNVSKGKYELLAGRNNTALGISSVAFGDSNIVVGESSTAIAGNQQYINGENSATTGNDNYTNGKMAFTSGWNNINNGDNATIGSGSHNIIGANAAEKAIYVENENEYSANTCGGTVTKGGSNVFIAGKNNRVSGWNSVAFNENNKVTAGDAFAAGKGNTVTGNYSAAFGQENTISEERGLSNGISNSISAKNSIVSGRDNYASDSNAGAVGDGNNLVSGYKNSANGDRIGILGLENKVFGSNSVALGNKCTIGYSKGDSGEYDSTAIVNNSVALGNNAHCTKTGTVAIGCHVTADALNQVVLGKNNIPRTAVKNDGSDTDGYVFIVGNGTSSTPHNAIEVYKNSGEINLKSSHDNSKINILATGNDTGDITIMASGANDGATLTLAAEGSGTGLMRFSTNNLQYKLDSENDDAYEEAVQSRNVTLNYGGTSTIARIFGTDIKVTMPSALSGGSGSTVYKCSETSSSKSLLTDVNLGYTAFGASVTDRYYSGGTKTKQTYCYPVRVNSTNHLNARISAATTNDFGVVKTGTGIKNTSGLIKVDLNNVMATAIGNEHLLANLVDDGGSEFYYIITDDIFTPAMNSYILSFYDNPNSEIPRYRHMLWYTDLTSLDFKLTVEGVTYRVTCDTSSIYEGSDNGRGIVIYPTDGYEGHKITIACIDA